MGKAPAFQFYAADFLIGVGEFTLEEIGLYIKLLAYSWDKGALPLSSERLACLVGISERKFIKLWRTVGKKWTATTDGHINERLEQQRAERDAYAAKQAENGRRSGEARRTKREPNVNDGSTNVPTKLEPNTNSSVFDLQTSDHRLTKEQSDGVTRARADEPLVNGRAMRLHGQHTWCSLPREGLCVPAFLHREFLGKSQRPESELRAWYAGVVARFDGQPVGEDALLFWRREFSAWIGVASTAAIAAPTTKGARAVQAFRAAAEAIESRGGQ